MIAPHSADNVGVPKTNVIGSTVGRGLSGAVAPAGRNSLWLLIGAVLVSLATMATVIFAHGNLHSDEPMCADMAINLIEHRGSVNNAHSDWPPDTPGMMARGMAPHTLGLTAWLTLFGTSRHAVISFNSAVYALTAGILVLLARRMGLLTRATTLLALPVLFFCHPSSTYVYSINRYDALGCPLLLGGLAALFLKRPIARGCVLVVIASLAPFVGLQVALAGCILAVLAAVIAIWWPPAPRYRLALDCLAFVVIAATCTLSLIAMARSQGTLDQRLTPHNTLALLALTPASVARTVAECFIGGKFASPASTGVFPLVMTLVLFAGYAAWYRRKDPRLNGPLRIASIGLAVNFAISLGIGFLGFYYHRYTWLVTPALLLAVISCVEGCGLPKTMRALGVIAAVIAVLPGLPASLFAAGIEWPDWDYRRVNTFVSQNLTGSDVAYADYGAYYPTKSTAPSAYFGAAFHLLDPERKRKLDVLVLQYPRGNPLSPEDATVFAEAGGDWQLIDELRIPRGPLRMMLPRQPQVPTTWHFKIYRRK